MHRSGSVCALVATIVGWLTFLFSPSVARAAEQPHRSEADLVLPDLATVEVLGMSGHDLLLSGLVVSGLGILFGVVILLQLKNLPTHSSMAEISAIIWETCKTYLITQGKFILALYVLIGTIIAIYFGVLRDFSFGRVAIILLFSLIGILEIGRAHV